MLIDIVIFGKTIYLSEILTRNSFSRIKKQLINKEILGCVDLDVNPIFDSVNISKISHKIVIKKITKYGIIGELTILNTERGNMLKEMMASSEVIFKPILKGGFSMWKEFYVKDIMYIHAHPVKYSIKEIRIKKLNNIFGENLLK
jgi:hypothetical protein